MNLTAFRGLLILLCILAFSSVQAQVDYYTEIEDHRAEKNAEWLELAIPDEDRSAYGDLNYYPTDERYKVKATFTRSKGEPSFDMPTSSERTKPFRKYGELSFEINGRPVKLTVYQNLRLIQKQEYVDYLFVPFTDNTTGDETYGGGRYLDFRVPETEEVELDFNLCYHPYCAYGGNWSCPIPPAENSLDVSILAGEKLNENQEHDH